MADQNNPGQFGNREDTEEQARKGGQASSGSFGSSISANPSQVGQKGAEAQPTEAKARGGENSHQSSNN